MKKDLKQEFHEISQRLIALNKNCANKPGYKKSPERQALISRLEDLKKLLTYGRNKNKIAKNDFYSLQVDILCSRLSSERRSKLEEAVVKIIDKKANNDFTGISLDEVKNLSFLSEEDEEVLYNKYPSANRKLENLSKKLTTVSNILDDSILPMKGMISPEEWNKNQEFNKLVIRLKREIVDCFKECK